MERVRAVWVGRLVMGATVLALSAARAGELEPPPEGLDAREVSRRADRNLRGERTFLEARLTLSEKPSDQSKPISFRLWDDRTTARCSVRVLAPKNVAGTAFLKLPPNLWTYEPDADRPRRLRPAELKSRLLGSEFRIDDLTRMLSLAKDYEVRLLGIDPTPDGMVERRAYVLEYVRRDAVPGHWSRILAWVDTLWGAPLRREFYDDEGTLVRVIQFGGIRDVKGRNFPHVWTAHVPKSDRQSRIDVERVDFEMEIVEATFATRNLMSPE